jgi:DUF1009 family protein
MAKDTGVPERHCHDGAAGSRAQRHRAQTAVLEMTPDDIKSVVSEVLAEQAKTRQEYLDDAMVKTVAAILTSFGIEEEDRKEVRADFIHLRKWRKSVEQAQSYTFKAALTIIVTGFLGAMWLGFKAMLGK